MLTGVVVLLALCISILAHDNHQTRKALKHMSQSLDNLTAAVTTVENSVAAAVAEIGTLHAGSADDSAQLDALTVRLTTASNALTAAIAPKPAA